MGKSLKSSEIASLGDLPIEFDAKGKALCPFHDDSRPSLTVFESRYGGHRYHCFACGAQGWVENLAADMSGGAVKSVKRYNPTNDQRSQIREEYVTLLRDWESAPSDDYHAQDLLTLRAVNLLQQDGIASRVGYLWAVEEQRVGVSDSEHLLNLHRHSGIPEEWPIVGRLDPLVGLRPGGKHATEKLEHFAQMVRSGVVDEPYCTLHSMLIEFDRRRIEKRIKNGESLVGSEIVQRHATVAAREFWRGYAEGVPSGNPREDRGRI